MVVAWLFVNVIDDMFGLNKIQVSPDEEHVNLIKLLKEEVDLEKNKVSFSTLNEILLTQQLGWRPAFSLCLHDGKTIQYCFFKEVAHIDLKA